MSIAVEHERFILTAKNESERILLPTASRCKEELCRSKLKGCASERTLKQRSSGGSF
jgi:hypothetical protein